MRLNQQSPIPLYRQLADRLLADIDAGVHAVATRIPSEHELAQQFDIGRPTVRQATDLLVRKGRLERRRGSGTYVLPPARTIDVFSLAGTSAALAKSDLSTKLRLVGQPTVEPAAASTSAQAINAGGRNVATSEQERVRVDRIRIERVATVESNPILYETLWFDAELFKGLEKRNVGDEALSTIVRDNYFLEPSSAEQSFAVVKAGATHAKRLSIQPDESVLRVYRKLHFLEHTDALHVEMICLTDRFEFSQVLYPGTADEPGTQSRYTESL